MPSAVPIEVFWHVVYSSVCKHLYLYARSRRTSGSPWRPVSGPRPPLPSVVARSFSPVPKASRPPRLRGSCTVPTKRSAMPFMPSTNAVSRCCILSRRVRTRRRPSSPQRSASPSGRCCTRVHGPSASLPAGGPFSLPPRSVSLRGSRRGWSAMKPFGWPSADWAWPGNAPNIGSPVPTPRTSEKKRRDRLMALAATHPTWALGWGAAVWWSRLAQPNQHGWTDAEATYKLQELTRPTDDPDPKALACYGLLVRSQPQEVDQMWLRFVAGRPVSAVTIEFLAWCSAQLAAQGFTALLLIWDNASWHRSRAVRHWIRQHNQQIKRGA